MLDEKIRETLSGMTEGISATDDLKEKMMKEIEIVQTNNRQRLLL